MMYVKANYDINVQTCTVTEAKQKLYHLKEMNENEYGKGVFVRELCNIRDTVMEVTGFDHSEVTDMIHTICVD